MKKIVTTVTEQTTAAASYVLDAADTVSVEVKKSVEHTVAPVRQSILKRYPVLFWLLVTFGLATTYYAFEKILSQYEILNQYPWLILALGISVLTFTGTLYKRLR